MKPHKTRNLVVFDIDGTIADPTHRDRIAPWRLPLFHTFREDHEHEEWNKYYKAMSKDSPIEAMFKMAWAMNEFGFELGLATGRPERYRHQTEQWLIAWNFPPVKNIVMRPVGNNLSNVALKVGQAHFYGVDRIALWIDDNPEVETHLKRVNVPVLSIQGNY